MPSENYGLLEAPEEDSLHKSRLLPIEQKPFQRITNRLLNPDSLLVKRPHLPSPPPDSASDAEADKASTRASQLALHAQWREDMNLDFAALETAMVRTQLLINSNFRERARYADEKLKIEETAESIKRNTGELRGLLEEAKGTMERRRKWDDKAELILKNKTLKSLEDQGEAMKRTQKEIEEEEARGLEFEDSWTKRREQFERIVEECKALQRVIRDEKEESERAEGMEGGAESGTQTSAVGTPAAEMGDATPLPNHEGEGLRPLPAGSRAGSRRGSRAVSPSREDDSLNEVVMGEAVGTPAATHSSLEEGEEGEASEIHTPMET